MDKQKVEIESLIYRMNKIEEKCLEMKHFVSGTGKSYEDLLKSNSGKFSAKKFIKMSEDLADCLNEYRQYIESVKGGHLATMKDEEFSAEEREFYEAYFYLYLGLATYDNSGLLARFFRPGTWDAFLDRVDEELEYASDAELDAEIILNDLPGEPLRWNTAGLINDICDAYRFITGEDFSSVLTEEERKASYKYMTKQEVSFVKNPDKKIKAEIKEQEDNLKILEEILQDPEFQKGLEKVFEEEIYKDSFEESDSAEKYNASIDSWKKYFSDKERFKQSCLIVKKGILKRYGKGIRFRKEIRMAVQLYLWKNGISDISDEDMFMIIYAYLNKALKISELKINDVKISKAGKESVKNIEAINKKTGNILEHKVKDVKNNKTGNISEHKVKDVKNNKTRKK